MELWHLIPSPTIIKQLVVTHIGISSPPASSVTTVGPGVFCDCARCALLPHNASPWQQFQCMMTPVCSWQDCLQLASLIKTFSRLSRLSSQIKFLSITLLPSTSSWCPVKPWERNVCWTYSYSECLWIFGKPCSGPALSLHSPFPPQGRKNWQQTAFLPSCHWADCSCAVFCSGLGYPQPGTKFLCEQSWRGIGLVRSTDKKTTFSKNPILQMAKPNKHKQNKQNPGFLTMKVWL